ncbi:MAG: TonB-dependent receptor, partial [Bryobacteraceae bacterium]
LASLLTGQSFYGTLRGIVRDPNGSVIPKVKVSLIDQATRIVRTTYSSEDGEYSFSQLVPATFTVVAESAGFKRFEQSDVTVGTQAQINLDLSLPIGDVSQTVEVKGEIPVIETANASQGQSFSSGELSQLPNFGRNAFGMSRVSQNVTPVGNPSTNNMQTQSATALTSVAGGMLWQNSYIIDGVPSTAWFGLPIIIPSLEAVAEMKVQVNTYDSELGRTGGGVFNTVLKSGTNDLHGSAYGHIRRTSMDANLFFNNAAGRQLSPIPDDTWAGSIGGPVWIPKLYNGKNRTFFFLALEGYNNAVAYSTQFFVPTALERTGDFSQSKASNGAPLVIYNPLSTVQNADGSYTRTPFANNVIPPNMRNNVGLNIAGYYPVPTSQPAFYGAPDVTASTAAVSHARQYIGKMDHQIFNWWRATLTEIKSYSIAPGPNYFGGVAAPQQWRLNRSINSTALNNLLTISPTATLAVRYGFNRFPNVFYTTSEVQGFDITTLGFPSSFASQTMGRKFPIISMSTVLAGDSLSNGNGSYNNYVNHTLSAVLSKSLGRHNLKAGFDYRKLLVAGFGYGSMSGSFSFNGSFTQSSPVRPVAGTGADLADMLLGYPSSGEAIVAQKLSDFTHYYALYVQDDYRVSNRLTLNLGLRWDREEGLREEQDRVIVNFDKQAANPLAAGVTGIQPKGVLQFAGDGGNRTSVGNPNLSKFAPRLGFAYQLGNKTVIRGGYGLMWAPQATPGSPLAPASYAATTPYIATTNGFATPAGSLSNPFPNGLIQPAGKSQGALTGIGQSVSLWAPFAQSPRIQQFSFDVQRELPGGIALVVGYLGTRARHLTGSTAGLDVNQNFLDPSNFALGAGLNATVANPFYGKGGTGILGNPTVQAYQLLLPYPTYGGVVFSSTDFNHSHYDSLVVKGEKHFSMGLTFLSTLTWAKSFDLASAGNVMMAGPSGLQNPLNIESEYAQSNWQPVRTWSTVFTYELPFGKGKSMLGSNRALDYVVGGWQVNGVGVYRTGFPISITQSQNLNAAYGYAGQRPNATGTSPVTTGSLEQRLRNYINPAAFSTAPQFTFGNISRSLGMRGPGQANWDLSLFKSVTIIERLKAQFRLEALNAMNTPLFSGPNSSFGTSAFGQITSQANTARQLQLGLRFQW